LASLSEIEQLENETTSLKNETRSLIDNQKELMTVLKAAYEKINAELRMKNDALRKENGRLQIKIDEMQAKLEKTSEPVTVVGVGIGENAEQVEVVTDTELPSTVESDTADKMSDEEKAKRRWLF
jgi:predicted  nucleic acid-binding Zn-ribbon protein